MIAGRYKLVRELGRGASGAVHLAQDEMLGRPVALKKLGMAPGEDTADATRSAREARIAAALSHPNVVAVYDLAEHDGAQWLVMEYVEGTTLSELIRSRGQLTPQEAAPLLAQVADALAEAHQHGIVHRDVKPSNVFVTPEGVAKLGDFGIARGRDDAALTRTGLVTGSPAYLAPEVLSGASATPSSDIWSFGATLHHALDGTPPYDIGDNLVSGLLKIVQDPVPMLDDAGELSDVLDNTMVKRPEHRWDAATLARALRTPAALRRTPAVGLPVGDATQAMPLPRPASAPPADGTSPRSRRPVLLGVGVLVTLLLLAGAGVAWWPDDASAPTAGAPATREPGTGQQGGQQTAEDEKPTDEATTDDGATAEDTEEALESFVSDYLGLVVSDPEQAYARLTPEFQAASGGESGYLGWWRTVQSADVLNVKADPEALTVSYTVKYVMTDGRKSTERVDLQLYRHGETYLIAGEG